MKKPKQKPKPLKLVASKPSNGFASLLKSIEDDLINGGLPFEFKKQPRNSSVLKALKRKDDYRLKANKQNAADPTGGCRCHQCIYVRRILNLSKSPKK